ncbi:MAG TPA: hypothetical protein VJW76_04590 [Verrucomicrobiae bacterium]|nr:hypothetical protein [Verrucomicrobiae bacterium]
MKTSFIAVIVSALALGGCGQKDQGSTPAKSTNAPAASGNPVTAPVDYLGALAKAKKSSEKTIDTASLNKAIQLFQVSEGRYPKDLNELVTEKYLTKLPEAPYGTKIVYDATKGEVKVVPQ